jgi:CRISPR-associated endonuclease/helicase Cas3
MSELPSLSPDDFAAFFRAVHGHDPFPWQQRLARRVAESGWPSVLDLPTGSGKTAALDVAVFAVALAAGQRARTAPIRIVYVVDRRTVVDQAYERAEKIREALSNDSNDVVRRVRERLESFSGEKVALGTALLRGGIARDETWARAPDQPLIAVSTVDQVGSRLLFRGYGVTDSMKPVHAGLLGQDVLYLLDEVHLSNPFRETLKAIKERYRKWAERELPGEFIVVEMSATPGRRSADAFQLEEADRLDPHLSRRLESSKPVSLVQTNARGFSKEIEKHVLSMLARPGATVAVVVNRVKSARELHAHLREVATNGSTVVHLLTGRMRPFDRDALEQSLLKRIRSGRTRQADDTPLVIVATQSIEAGADFDFDGLITECASLDALRQRFGRMDRLGELAGTSRGVIVARSDSLQDDPVYGNAIGATWNWLQQVATEQTVDFGISALTVPDDAEQQGLLAHKAHAPVLLPSHLDAWVQTAPIPDPDPDVALWLHGPQRGVADVQIVWRADLTSDLLTQAIEGDTGNNASEIAIGMVEALPPVSGEAMSVPFLAAKRWLAGQTEPDSFDVEGAAELDEERGEPRAGSSARPAIVWQGERSSVITADKLRPGHTLVVPSSYGGIKFHNWAPAAQEPISDIAELTAMRQGRRPIVRFHPAVAAQWLGPDPSIPTPDSSESETTDDRQVVLDWLAGPDPMNGDHSWRPLLQRLRSDDKAIRVERMPRGVAESAGEYFVVTGTRRSVRRDQSAAADDHTTADETRSSFTGVAVTLADHLEGVAAIAAGFAERLGLPEDLVADLRLSGQWHDAGKADPRFQRWLHGGSEFKALVQAAPLAKSATRLAGRTAIRRARERAGYPAGTRHELMSVALLAAVGEPLVGRAGDPSLVTHLIASHHGHGRPFAPWVADPIPVTVAFSRDGIDCRGSSAHELARLDSGIAERFWEMVRRYGWWGLAQLETLLRLADHRQSEREQDTKGTHRA